MVILKFLSDSSSIWVSFESGSDDYLDDSLFSLILLLLIILGMSCNF